MKRITAILILLLASVLVFFLSCSNKDKGEEDNLIIGPDLSGVKTLTITPAGGIPGSIIKVSGYLIESDKEEQYSIWIGDDFAPYSLDADSTISVMLPLFLGADGWPVPSTEPLTVELRKNDTLIAHAPKALTIKVLPKAPGSTQKAEIALESVASSIDALWTLVPPENGMEQPLREAIGAMLRGLLLEGDSSLASILDGTSSLLKDPQKDLELIDAMLASSGALDYLEAYASGLANLQQKAQKAISSGSAGFICRSGGADIDLACKMQIYVLLKDYAEVFVHPTAQTYGHTVGLFAAAIAVSGVGVPAAAVVGAILTVADFIMGKLVPSLFPAQITAFSLEIEPDTIAVGGITNSTIMISAANNPEMISLSDLVNILLATMGAKGPRSTEFAEDFITILKNAAEFVMNLYKDILVAYNQANPGTFIDPSFLMPAIVFGPVEVRDPDMVEKFSFTPETILAEEGEGYEWEGLKKGEGRVQARTRAAGERSKVVIDNSMWIGISWWGGAFGNEIAHSATKTVIVGKPATLLVDITGLPNGTDANVIVSGTEFSSGRLTATDTLSDLSSGDYVITAIEVQDGNGESYLPSPISTSITLVDNDYQTVSITYEPEFGNMLLTVTGLPDGIDADIDLAGPEMSNHHAVSDTLLDSLTAGAYSITAHDVLDLDGVTNLIASPQSQNVDVIAGETAIANVTYSPASSMKVYLGSYDHSLTYFSEFYRPMTRVHCGSPDGQSSSSDSVFVPDLSYGIGCILEGGLEVDRGESYAFSSSCASGTASGSVSLTIQFGGDGQEILIDASISVSAAPPGPTDSTPNAQFSAGTTTSLPDPASRLILEVANDVGKNLAFEITYNISGSRSGDLGAMYGVGFMINLYSLYDCPGNSAYWYLRPSFVGDGLSASGVDTVSLEHASLDHLSVGIHATGRADGTTYLDQYGEVSETRGGQASAICSYKLRLIELPE